MTTSLESLRLPETVGTSWPSRWGPGPRYATPRTLERPTLGPAWARTAKALGRTLYPWQQYVADVAGERLADGSPAYDEVIVIVQRRGGKTVLIDPIAAHTCGQRDAAEVWLTAQDRGKAKTRWRGKATGPQAGGAELIHKMLPKITRLKISNGFEELRWTSGSLYVPFAPDEDSLHGEQPAVVLLDEYWTISLLQEQMIEAGYRPAWGFQPGQAYKLTAAGNRRSTALKEARLRGREAVLSGRTTGVAYFEFGLPERVGGVPVDALPLDVLLDLTLAAHPRPGLRLDYLRSEWERDPRDFLRAYGSIDADEDDADQLVFPAGRWELATRQPTRIPDGVRVGVGVELDLYRREAAISTAWRRPDGRVVLELTKRAPGTKWVGAYVAGLVGRDEQPVGAVSILNVGPSRSTRDELAAPGAVLEDDERLVTVAGPDFGAACSRFAAGIGVEDEADLPELVLGGEPAVEVAARSAQLVKRGGSEVLESRTGEPITALRSQVLALWAVDHMAAEAEPERGFQIW